MSILMAGDAAEILSSKHFIEKMQTLMRDY